MVLDDDATEVTALAWSLTGTKVATSYYRRYDFHRRDTLDGVSRVVDNGLPIKIGSKSVKFPITVENKNWGVHARP